MQSAFFAVHNPARRAVIPVMLPQELLPAANALSSLAMGVSLAVGPVVAGVLVDVAGYGWAYSVEALLMVAAMVLLTTLPPLPPEGEVVGRGCVRCWRVWPICAAGPLWA